LLRPTSFARGERHNILQKDKTMDKKPEVYVGTLMGPHGTLVGRWFRYEDIHNLHPEWQESQQANQGQKFQGSQYDGFQGLSGVAVSSLQECSQNTSEAGPK